MEKVKCGDCEYSEKVDNPMNIGHKTFVCHYNPPFPMLAPGPQGEPTVMGVFPIVGKNSWCGRGKRKESIQ